MERSTKQKMLAGGLSLAVITAFAVNTGPDEEPFKVTGTVTEVADNSVRLEKIRVLSGSNDAVKAFADGKETLYDGYNDGNCTRHETTTELDSLVASGQLVIGKTVEVTGNLGSSQINCFVDGYTKGSFYDTDYTTMTSIQLNDKPQA